MRLKTKISHLAIVLLVALNASPVFAITNKAAMCAPERRCTAGSPCGDGATCDTSERLRSFGVCNLTAPNEGRCITPAQQSCLPDDFCLGQDTAVLPPAPVAPTICCQCVRNSQNSCVQFSDITSCGQYAQSQSYQTFNNSNASAMQGVTCSRVLSATECRTVANGGVCGSNPGIVSDVYAPVVPPIPATPPRAAIIPQLGVSIPGLRFTQPSTAGGTITTSFLAEYISAIYRYGVQISVFVAIIMVIYGGFRYLIGSGAGDIKRGRQIIQDAILGMLIVLSAYVLLNTINPATLDLNRLGLTAIIPLTDNMNDSAARDVENNIVNTTPCTLQDTTIPTNVTWSYCSYARIGTPPCARAQFKATLRPVNVGQRSSTWCAACSNVPCGNSGLPPDAICRAIAGQYGEGVPCGGGFGLFLRAMTANCNGKHLTNADGLDGLTFGIQDLTIDNLPTFLQTMDRVDHASFERTFSHTADFADWYRNGTINRDWFCQQQISQRGMACNANFMQAFRQGLALPASVTAQLRQAYNDFHRNNAVASTYFNTMRGHALFTAFANNPGACGTQPLMGNLANSCASAHSESEKITCWLNNAPSIPCRNNAGGALSRANSISQAIAGVPAITPAGGTETLEDIIQRCVPGITP